MDIERINHPNAEAERAAARIESARAAVEQAQFELDHAQSETDVKIWTLRVGERQKDLERIENEQISDIAA